MFNMNTKGNIHGGHRERLLNKFVQHPDSLSDHELLEIMLFSFIPRVNTNEIAHTLLYRYGSIENVFAMSAEELINVEGLGKKTAAAISLCGKIYGKIYENRISTTPKPWIYFVDYDKMIRPDFIGLKDEKFIAYFLNENHLLFYKIAFTNKNSSSVYIDMAELTSKIALKKPRYLIVAHNHPSGSNRPSREDDESVRRIVLACDSCGCTFFDSLIFGNNETYSYYLEQRLESSKPLKDVLYELDYLEGARQW